MKSSLFSGLGAELSHEAQGLVRARLKCPHRFDSQKGVAPK